MHMNVNKNNKKIRNQSYNHVHIWQHIYLNSNKILQIFGINIPMNICLTKFSSANISEDMLDKLNEIKWDIRKRK